MQYYSVDADKNIAVQDINPGGSKTVFMIHEWPLDHTIFEYQANILPHYGFRCVLPDLRGFGKSDMPTTGYAYDAIAQDIARIIEAMQLRDIVLAGFGVGAALAITYAAQYGATRLKKLALIGAAAPCFTQRVDFNKGRPMRQIDALIRAAGKNRPKMADEYSKMLFATTPDPALRMWIRDIAWRSGGVSTIGLLESMREADLRPVLPRISVPTGIFHGRQDRVCPYDLALELRKGIKNSQLYTFEKSGHAVFYDEMEKFNDVFLKFIS